jgi:type IV pilus assembly protein PilA
MLTLARKRLAKDEEDGFTLIELMVVVLIIAILLAIAIPTFLGAQNRARDRGAQSNLRNAITAAKTIATDQVGQFVWDHDKAAGTPTIALNDAALRDIEANITFVNAAPVVDEVRVVGTKTSATASNVVVQTLSASGTVYGMASDETGKVLTCKVENGAAATDCATYGAFTATGVKTW